MEGGREGRRATKRGRGSGEGGGMGGIEGMRGTGGPSIRVDVDRATLDANRPSLIPVDPGAGTSSIEIYCNLTWSMDARMPTVHRYSSSRMDLSEHLSPLSKLGRPGSTTVNSVIGFAQVRSRSPDFSLGLRVEATGCAYYQRVIDGPPGTTALSMSTKHRAAIPT